MSDLSVKAALDEMSKKVDAAIQKVNTEVEEQGKATEESRSELKSFLAAHNDIKKDLESVKDDVVALAQKAQNPQPAEESKTMGQIVIASPEFKSFHDGQ